MKTQLTTLSIVLFISVGLFSCRDRDKDAADVATQIAVAQEQARKEAKLEAEIARLKADQEANARKAVDDRADARAKAAEDARRDELARNKADMERSAADAQRALDAAAAKGDKSNAELRRQIAALNDSIARANSAAEKARADATLAAAKRRLADAERDRKIAELKRLRQLNGGGSRGGVAPSLGRRIIGVRGGQVVAADGTGSSVTVPPGALNANTPVSITTVPPPSGAACAVVCTPAGKQWNPPVTVRFRLPVSRFTRIAGRFLRVRFWNPITQRYHPERPPIFATVDRDTRFASALVPHFSTIVIMDGPSLVKPPVDTSPRAFPKRRDGMPYVPKKEHGIPEIPDIPEKDYGDEKRDHVEPPFLPENKDDLEEGC